MAAPGWLIAALISGTSCALSPENERATKVAPIRIARDARSMPLSLLTAPFLATEPLSAVAENWPLVRPYTPLRSKEHTSELQSLMRISYAVFCLTKNKHPY